MFSKQLNEFVQKNLDLRQTWLAPMQADIDATTATCDADEATLLRYFYATMPLRDAAAYPAQVFASYAKHAMMLRRNVEWCKALPEEIFLHHVAYFRVNSENIEPCRAEFFSLIYPRVLGKTVEEAVLEINYWCGEHVRYTSSDMRTASPMTVYRAGVGRCGEESTFAVTALRSVGLAARQVYTPRWGHCDDNHAWVEVYVGDRWHFLGACEPEEVLDRGWFTAAAARALLIHSRNFSDDPEYGATPINKSGLLTYYNSTDLYATTKPLTVRVTTTDGATVQDANVSLEIFNMAELVSITRLHTNAEGCAFMEMGLGDVVAIASHHNAFGCVIVPHDVTEATVVLDQSSLTAALEHALKGEIDFLAPPAAPGKGAAPNAAQKQRNAERLKEATALRETRQESFFDAETAKKYPEAQAVLQAAKGNFAQIYAFLDAPDAAMRLRMIKSLSDKDCQDAVPALLEVHYQDALSVQSHVRTGTNDAGEPVFGTVSDEIFDTCILSPRIGDEELTDYRAALRNGFSQEQKDAFVRNPLEIARWISENIGYTADLDYSTIYTPPAACLCVKDANDMSKHILFVAVCRALGIPARLHPNSRLAEYYENGNFVAAWAVKQEANADATLALHTETPVDLVYYTTWTLALYVQNNYRTMEYTGTCFDAQGALTLSLQPGAYRLITTARMPNGNQKLSVEFFTLNSGETLHKELSLQQGALSDYLMSITLPEVTLSTQEGEAFTIQQRFAGQKTVLAFLEEGKEPTEHVLNEMLDKCEGTGMSWKPIFVVRSQEALQNATFARVLRTLPSYELYTADFDTQLEPLARQMFTDHEKLPLLVVLDAQGKGTYASSGYRVGSVDLIEKLLAAMN